MSSLMPVLKRRDIMPDYLETPIGKLLEYHNLGRDFDSYKNAPLLIGMCMDNRKKLNIPDNFAYILRTGGGNLRSNEFKISYAVAMGKVTAITIIAHDDCGMVNLAAKKENFITGLVENGGWSEEYAENHFDSLAPFFELGNEIEFAINEATRLNFKYPNIQTAPLFYSVEDKLLYQIIEE